MLKKYIVALVIALNILLCKFVEALIQTDTNVVDLMTVETIVEMVKTPKTIIQVFREIVHPNILSSESSVIVDVLLFIDGIVTFFTF